MDVSLEPGVRLDRRLKVGYLPAFELCEEALLLAQERILDLALGLDGDRLLAVERRRLRPAGLGV